MGEPGLPDLPGYEMLGVLGQGGFGVVYRARQLAVGREVAVKIDNRPLLAERDRRRFVREVTAAGALSGHPHVADVYDAGMLPDGRPYMVLELCPGGSLADRLRRDGPLPAAEVRDIGVRIADALAAAHAQGVLHRDVKPGNILINRFGLVALSDFGLAAMPEPGRELSVTLESLTPAFAPPEAFELGEPTEAGDVYALAATLYTLLNGRPPRFPADGVVNIGVIFALHRLPIPDIPGVPPELTAVLRHGMATDPRERLPGAAALRDALAAVPLDGPVSGMPSGPVPGWRAEGGDGQGPAGPPAPWGRHEPSGGRAGAGPGPAAPPAPAHAGPDAAPAPGGAAAPMGAESAAGPYPPHGPAGVAHHPPGSPGAPPQPGDRQGYGSASPASPAPPPAGHASAGHATRPPHARHGHVTGPPDGRGTSPASSRPPRRRGGRTAKVLVAIATVFAIGVVIGVGLTLRNGQGGQAGGTTARPRPAATGGDVPATPAVERAVDRVRTTTESCPAARVAGANAACVVEAECWSGILQVLGEVQINRRACDDRHVWETFAVAPLPVDGTTWDAEELERHPVVKRLCSRQVLLASRIGDARRIPPSRWLVAVVPPSKEALARGVRAFRCVGAVPGEDRPGSRFRPIR